MPSGAGQLARLLPQMRDVFLAKALGSEPSLRGGKQEICRAEQGKRRGG
jgi:hypothetical protein